MKVLRFLIAVAALLLVWLVVSLGVGLLIGIVFQPKNGAHFLGFWLDWHALPGLVIGLVMGVRVFRAIAGTQKKGTDDTNAAKPAVTCRLHSVYHWRGLGNPEYHWVNLV